jgi:hypothetical protein
MAGWGWLGYPQRDFRVGRNYLVGLWVVSATPKISSPPPNQPNGVSWPPQGDFWGGRNHPVDLGVVSATHKISLGVAKAFGHGVAPHP